MAFVPNCGAVVASHNRRMRELEEEKKRKREQQLLLNKGVRFKMNGININNIRFDVFEIDDSWFDLGKNITKEIQENYKSTSYTKRKVLDVQIIPYEVKHKCVEKWKVFVKYIEERNI